MQITTVENGITTHRWVNDYALLFRRGKVRSRHGSYNEMWAAWERLNLAWLHWRDEKTQKSWFIWVRKI